ncbi:MAG: hypothetical protein ACHQNA_00890 [Acidimicrobiales bacterium]
MIGRAPRGLWPAVTDIQRVVFSRLRLYEHYDRDDRLRDALLGFHGEWWTRLGRSLRRLDDRLPDLDDAERQLADLVGSEPAHDYLDALSALATEAGLDRIPMVGSPVIGGYLSSGLAQVHRCLWGLDKALLWEAAPAAVTGSLPPVRRPTFVALASAGWSVPAVDTSIAGTDARWDPRTELLVDARRRLRRETDLAPERIETELQRIADEGGYQFPDTSSQRSGIWRLERDVEWVWWRIRWGWTYAQIAEEWERLHPGDHRLQPHADDFARDWEANNPDDVGSLENPADAARLVRKAVTTFAERARVNVGTRPGPSSQPSSGRFPVPPDSDE